MPTYLSPGVYVEEVASAVQPIAGVSTSTPGFIGVMGNSITIPTAPPIEVTETITDVVDGSGGKSFQVKNFRTDLPAGTVEFRVDGEVDSTANFDENASTVTFDTAPANGAEIVGYYVFLANQVTNKSIGTGNGSETVFALPDYPVYIESGMSEFKVNGTVDSTATLSEALDDEGNPLVQVTFVGSPPADKAAITGSYIRKFPTFKPAPAGET
ncbi:MAG: hypothetical protein QNJ46_29655, partial [Leptolyngbyaceae cyanobacterium MO_188.B28]|nr:hypothetical protein [Leptolyngbyaceae cyanobacterium MO_188.B28]